MVLSQRLQFLLGEPLHHCPLGIGHLIFLSSFPFSTPTKFFEVNNGRQGQHVPAEKRDFNSNVVFYIVVLSGGKEDSGMDDYQRCLAFHQG